MVTAPTTEIIVKRSICLPGDRTTIAGTEWTLLWVTYLPLMIYVGNVICIDTLRNIYIADGLNQRVRKIDAATNFITTIAGIGIRGYSGDNGLATNAQLNEPPGLFVGKDRIYIADYGNGTIRKIDAEMQLMP